jgi:hypothetical protein
MSVSELFREKKDATAKKEKESRWNQKRNEPQKIVLLQHIE